LTVLQTLLVRSRSGFEAPRTPSQRVTY